MMYYSNFETFWLEVKWTNAHIFFADPCSSWQKGAIENANKLIRQYIPKGVGFDDFSDEFIKSVQYKTESSPQRKIGFFFPFKSVL